MPFCNVLATSFRLGAVARAGDGGPVETRRRLVMSSMEIVMTINLHLKRQCRLQRNSLKPSKTLESPKPYIHSRASERQQIDQLRRAPDALLRWAKARVARLPPPATTAC